MGMLWEVPVLGLPGHRLRVFCVVIRQGHTGGAASVEGAQSGELPGEQQAEALLACSGGSPRWVPTRAITNGVSGGRLVQSRCLLGWHWAAAVN